MKADKQLKSLISVFYILLWLILAVGAWGIYYVSPAEAQLSDETLDEVNRLRWKHSPFISMADITIDPFDYNDWVIYFEDGKMFVETRKGKWFIEMEKVN